MPERPATSSVTRLSRPARQAQTREALLATARRLFIENGYGGTSIRDIAEQAGYSQGAFYSNFDSKEALLLELLRGHMQAEAEQLAVLVAPAQRSLEAILDDLQAWAGTLDSDVNWSMLSVELQLNAQRCETFAAAYRAIWQQHAQTLAQLIGQMFAQRGMRPPVANEAIASALMALVHGLALQRAATGTAATGQMVVIFLRGLLALAENSTT
ncbi:TetR/AcrR family transcriptional regulator [Corticibacter populi]|nr:TetR/AcrR family transcriptional regulator [Corticibacter populi]